VEMLVNYRELDVSFKWPTPPPKWKSDPDVDPNQFFHPMPTLYTNGQLVKQLDRPMTKITRQPPLERRVPRRGLMVAHPSDLDYEELCRKQGLAHLIQGSQVSPSSTQEQSPVAANPNGNALPHEDVNGITPPSSIRTQSINEGSPLRELASDAGAMVLTNGIHGSSVSPTSTIPPTHK
jgi:hypothetical protein